MTKTEIRKKILSQLKEMSEDQYLSLSEKIFQNLVSLSEYKNCWNLMTYVSFDKEPDTIQIIKDALGKAKTVCVPLVDWEKNSMVPVQIFSIDDIDFSSKVPQPLNQSLVNINEIELVIVPGVAFDVGCNRLGRGKGFYDRFLPHCNGLKIGLAFEFQILNELPLSPDDVPVDFVITEARIIRRS
ncbi:MAG: 5-formyltetrahydrofolate cyclo-ligase [Candidatus Omnitrophica bacterium]|nr:5-formyltetrahydrofolate cyclo-ligase [Candidatus Omnitrophota bacterium]